VQVVRKDDQPGVHARPVGLGEVDVAILCERPPVTFEPGQPTVRSRRIGRVVHK
jgi:hypothetical protein